MEDYEEAEVVARLFRYCNGEIDASWLGKIPEGWEERLYSTRSHRKLKAIIFHATIMLVRLEWEGRKDAAGR